MVLAAGLAVALAAGGVRAHWFEIQAFRYRRVIGPAARRYDVPPRLVAAVIWQETRFHPYRVGQAGEVGLMQVSREAAEEWARAEGTPVFGRAVLLNPATNVLVGAWYLGRALRRWSATPDPVPYALAEYNAGLQRARRWAAGGAEADPAAFVEAITYPTTQRYVREVRRRYGAGERAGQWPMRSR
jgi:soluble lytic murein transglycosylase